MRVRIIWIQETIGYQVQQKYPKMKLNLKKSYQKREDLVLYGGKPKKKSLHFNLSSKNK